MEFVSLVELSRFEMQMSSNFLSNKLILSTRGHMYMGGRGFRLLSK